MSQAEEGAWLRSSIGRATPDSIELRGHDLSREVMGEMTFSMVAFLVVAGRTPSSDELRLFDAVLCSLADHGLTPTALAARLTYTGAPEALQGAIAAGLLGGGSVFLGPVSDTAGYLASILSAIPAGEHSDDTVLKDAATDAVKADLSAGRRIPGLGHPIHKDVDPRTPRLYEIAEKAGVAGPHLRLLQQVAAAQRAATGRNLPINGAGAAGAALADLGFSPLASRGFALLARTAGLIGHLVEESASPIGLPLWKEIEVRANQVGDADEAGGSDRQG
jgi:citrate synthase